MKSRPYPTRAALDTVCPMHLRVDATGHIYHVGPTLQKLRPEKFWVGRRFLEEFQVKRPRELQSMQQLSEIVGQKLHLEPRDPPYTALKGVAVELVDDSGFLINLSFGISVLDAVGEYNLTNEDFAATDLTVEMLYLVEAKSAAMEASRKLNLRLQGAKLAAEEQALTDTLTGLRNRRALDQSLGRYMAARTPFSLMHIDLDHFKAINDTLGHAAGDQVLLNVATAFRQVTREGDIIARVGGDEFIILMPGEIANAQLQKIGSRIIEVLEVPSEYRGHTCRISGSIGTVSWDGKSEENLDTLLENADIALYASKHAGRGCQTFFSPKLRKAVSTRSTSTSHRQ